MLGQHYWQDPLHTVGGTSKVHRCIRICGGGNWGAAVRIIAVVVIAIVGSIAIVRGLGTAVGVVELVDVLVAASVQLWCVLVSCGCSCCKAALIMCISEGDLNEGWVGSGGSILLPPVRAGVPKVCLVPRPLATNRQEGRVPPAYSLSKMVGQN